MSFKIETARKEKIKIKLALCGPSGAGKTLGALHVAQGIAGGDWAKVYVVDTENRSSIFYAGQTTGDWKHIDFPSNIRVGKNVGYHPENWISLIETVESIPEAEVLVFDSFSHAYNGLNGLLEVVENNTIRGNQFTGWRVGTPLQRRLYEKIRSSRLHIIATMRAVTAYEVEKNDKGKSAPVKVGTKPQQREGVDYEFDIMFDVDLSHRASSNKDRSGLFSQRGMFQLTSEIGKELISWANDGAEPPTPPAPKFDTFDKTNVEHLDKIGKLFEAHKVEAIFHDDIIRELDGQPMALKYVEGLVNTVKQRAVAAAQGVS